MPETPSSGTVDPGKPAYLPPWWTAFNTSPTKGKVGGKDAYVVAIELGSPTELIGVRFTSVFAVCYSCAEAGDLSAGWEVLGPTDHIYTKARYSACPTIRWYDGWFYLVTLFEDVPNPRGPHCVRCGALPLASTLAGSRWARLLSALAQKPAEGSPCTLLPRRAESCT